MVQFKYDISVIIPTFNRAEQLMVALDSLARQDYDKSRFEILVVDNNSSDRTEGAVCRFRDEHPDISVRYIFEPRKGLVYARHAGAKSASFEILVFTDDDAILTESWLSEINDVFQLNNDIAAVAGKILIRWDEPPPGWVLPYEHLLGRLDYGDQVRVEKGLFINGGNFSIKKTVLKEVGGFNPDQIGAWLIGDGETGLCRKLHTHGYLIGWAPAALMEHFQIVRKNATFKDIKRRYINNGRSVPYDIFAVKKLGMLPLLKNLYHAAGSIKRSVRDYISACRSENRDDQYLALFNVAYYGCQFPYTFKLLLNSRFRRLISQSDWW
ncbi:MAG: glycosyltransferase family 2 protein [Geobacteraceae bacterium]|nr:glycosyltransferase family 2 protein [Geobacteraceae bacterium]